MMDWFFRHRDRVAVVASLGLLGAGWAMARLAPAPVPPPPPPDELRVTMEALPVQPPPVAVPTPLPQTVPVPPTPPVPAPVPTPSPVRKPVPVQAPTPSPMPAPVDAPLAPAPQAPITPAAPQVTAAHPPSPPTPAAPAPQSVAVQPVQRASVDEGYRAELRALIERAKRYPTSREARQLRPTGTVKVWLELDRAGTLQGAGVDAGSGSLLLDQEALRTVRLGRYPAFPPEAFAGQERHRFTLSLDYRLEGS
jgi:protein TonB